MFAPIYWAWVGTTIQSNVRDMTGPAARLAVFAVALAGLFMALAVPHAHSDTALLYAVALATAEVQIDIARLVLSYGHLAFIAAIIAVAVGMQEAVALPGSRLGWGTVGLLFGGVARPDWPSGMQPVRAGVRSTAIRAVRRRCRPPGAAPV